MSDFPILKFWVVLTRFGSFRILVSTQKKVHIDRVDNITNKYNTTYRTIKMMPIDVKTNHGYKAMI